MKVNANAAVRELLNTLRDRENQIESLTAQVAQKDGEIARLKNLYEPNLCPDCRGHGYLFKSSENSAWNEMCPKCKGTGLAQKDGEQNVK